MHSKFDPFRFLPEIFFLAKSFDWQCLLQYLVEDFTGLKDKEQNKQFMLSMSSVYAIASLKAIAYSEARQAKKKK